VAQLQNDLFTVGSALADPDPHGPFHNAIEAGHISRLEGMIDALESELSPLTNFILPGGAPAAAALHLARTVCRRAERLICDLAGRETINPAAVRYINRLSDHLFVLARHLNANGTRDVLWVPGGNR
jgi:cob(I)alamin adenosyltransferase